MFVNPKIPVLKPNPLCDDLEVEFLGVIRSQGWSPMNEISAFIEDTQGGSFPFCCVKKTAVYKAGRRASLDTEPVDLGLPSLQK